MKKKKYKLIFIIFIVLLLVGGSIKIFFNRPNNELKNEESNIVKKEKEEKNIKIINTKSNSRNIAIMFNNISTVWGYQTGLQDAYIVYEMIVEGGYTRLMGIFKDADIERIGSIRSSRPYFLDYALENDAIYIHFGASKQALSDINTLGVDNINFMNYYNGYWRDTTLNLATEHTAYTSTERINKAIEKYEYRNTTNEEPVLDYSSKEINLDEKDNSIQANSVYIKYSGVRSTSYKYDSDKKVYLRSQGTSRGEYNHIDAVTNKQYTAKNIIVYQVKSYSIDSYGRQALDNIGSGKGYYITNGYAIPITWEKKKRNEKTIYRYLDGKKIEVNDGNTFIQIQPLNQELIIE